MSDRDLHELGQLLDIIETYALEHCDEDADVQNTQPEDMVAHRNGLIVQLCRRAKELLK